MSLHDVKQARTIVPQAPPALPTSALAPTVEAPTGSPTWGWAVLEIRRDGTCSTPRLVPATGSLMPPTATGALASTDQLPRQLLTPVVHAQTGSLHLAEGRLHLAAAAFARGTRAPAAVPGRVDCLARLAHVLALQGELCRAEVIGTLVPKTLSPTAPLAEDHARAAQAWTAVVRADFAEANRLLSLLSERETLDQDPWLAASVLLLRSQLLIATHEADAAIRLLAGAAEARQGEQWPPWLTDRLIVSTAEALLAAGETRRALAVLTPIPVHAAAAAAVVAATALHQIGDARGSRSVLAKVEDQLDREPLALRLQAWVLTARLADDRGGHVHAHALLDRVLRTATPEQIRLPLLTAWSWIRRQVDRDPVLSRTHRDFLSTCDVGAPQVPAPRSPADPDLAPTTALTEREEQVLQLLAQMYSTEEIASALFISINTVKTHVKGIFGKLCVNRRVDAVRRGRQLGLC